MNTYKRSFGKGKKISLFTLGTMRVIDSVELMYFILKEACFLGINHIETSPSYGSVQKVLGSAINILKREGIKPKDGWVLTSKILPGINLSEGQKQLKQTISDIGVLQIDNLAVHGLNLSEHLDWAKHGEGRDLANWALDEGLISQFGFTSHGSQSLIKEAINTNLFTFCSLHLHLFDQERMPLSALALNKGMGVMAISPADKGGHLHSPSTTLIKDCAPFAPLELAYRFLLSQGISTLTIGASKPEDLAIAKRLINCAHPLTLTEKDAINHLKSEGKRRLGATYCGQCRKCLPCPNNVPIPEILRLRNLAVGHELISFTKERYNLIGRAGHWWEQLNANACNECGDCLPRCPHNLSIPTLLQETHTDLSDKPQRRLWG